MSQICVVCGRPSIFGYQGGVCKTCQERVTSNARHKDEGRMLAEAMGTFSLFDGGPKTKSRFKRKSEEKKKRSFAKNS